MTTGKNFYERPIFNSPYRASALHYPLDDKVKPLDGEPNKGRRPSRFIVPVPASRKKAAAAQAWLELKDHTKNALINEISGWVGKWRKLPNFANWGVSAATQQFLEHWRHHDFVGPQPFFFQRESVEITKPTQLCSALP